MVIGSYHNRYYQLNSYHFVSCCGTALEIVELTPMDILEVVIAIAQAPA